MEASDGPHAGAAASQRDNVGGFSLFLLFGTLPEVRTVVQHHVQQRIMDLQ
jgi:hypothetical protein